MAQTPLDYNELMFGYNGQPFEYKEGIITGGAYLKGQILVLDTGKYRAAVDADKATITAGYAILLVDTDASGGDIADVPVGKTGGAFRDKLIGAGLTVDDQLLSLLAINNIFAINGTNAMAIAGEGA